MLSCFDRIGITGTLPDIRHAQAMAVISATTGPDCLTTPTGQNPCAMIYATTPSSLPRMLAWRSSSSATTRPFARKTGSRPLSMSAVIIPAFQINALSGNEMHASAFDATCLEFTHHGSGTSGIG
jgi:hypothetical protein